MKQALAHYKPVIDNAITQALLNDLAQAGNWGHEINTRLARFVTQGKGVRGSLVCATFEQFAKNLPEEVVRTGAGIELIHAGLLIHDDIMDQDATRRGMATSHTHYAQLNADHPNPKHAGQSLAICEGDIAFFLGYTLLDPKVNNQIIRDIAHVGVAQMHDVTNEYQEITQEDILRCYEYKTARYTFSMPLWTGAMLANKPTQAQALYDIGIHLGLVYQLRDDELGLFGNPEITGKPQGTDIRQGKKTVYTALLKEHAMESDYERAQLILASQETTQEDVDWLTNLITTSGTRQAAKALATTHQERAQAQIHHAPLTDEHKQFLKEVLAYCTERQK